MMPGVDTGGIRVQGMGLAGIFRNTFRKESQRR